MGSGDTQFIACSKRPAKKRSVCVCSEDQLLSFLTIASPLAGRFALQSFCKPTLPRIHYKRRFAVHADTGGLLLLLLLPPRAQAQTLHSPSALLKVAFYLICSRHSHLEVTRAQLPSPVCWRGLHSCCTGLRILPRHWPIPSRADGQGKPAPAIWRLRVYSCQLRCR